MNAGCTKTAGGTTSKMPLESRALPNNNKGSSRTVSALLTLITKRMTQNHLTAYVSTLEVNIQQKTEKATKRLTLPRWKIRTSK